MSQRLCGWKMMCIYSKENMWLDIRYIEFKITMCAVDFKGYTYNLYFIYVEERAD